MNDVVKVCRKNDGIIRVTIRHGKGTFNVLNAYALQVGREESMKRKFWENLDDMVQNITLNEKLHIGGKSNGHEFVGC